ncbi:hypothetical protein F5146DRAFT_1131890 [Armillaria mellea]|nr:hypothetical protein F5146DRAFT_1131890 [Armillaria mellea]
MACTVELVLILSKRALTFNANPQAETVRPSARTQRTTGLSTLSPSLLAKLPQTWVKYATTHFLSQYCRLIRYIEVRLGAQVGGGITIWSIYNLNCTTIYTVFPHDIPSGTAVPHWAYLSLLSNGTVDIADAETDTGAEVTATATASSASTATSTIASGPETTSASSSGSSKGDTGGIVGGVVGGVLGVGAIVIGIIFFVLRRRQKRPGRSQCPEPIFVAPSSMGQKLYDPNDPSTFPVSHSPMSSGEYSYLVPPDQRPVDRRSPAVASDRPSTPGRGYRGVPEIDAESFNPLVPSRNASR